MIAGLFLMAMGFRMLNAERCGYSNSVSILAAQPKLISLFTNQVKWITISFLSFSCCLSFCRCAAENTLTFHVNFNAACACVRQLFASHFCIAKVDKCGFQVSWNSPTFALLYKQSTRAFFQCLGIHCNCALHFYWSAAKEVKTSNVSGLVVLGIMSKFADIPFKTSIRLWMNPMYALDYNMYESDYVTGRVRNLTKRNTPYKWWQKTKKKFHFSSVAEVLAP